jgi:4-amino-4-deoxy-L-arabinose transferase-like glycosyltransferase
MNPERATRAALAAVAAFAVGYLLPGTLQLPVLIYDPARHFWSFARTAPGVSMRYYGDLLVASIVSLAAAAAVYKLQPRRTPLPIAAATAMSLVALDVLYYLSRLLVAR